MERFTYYILEDYKLSIISYLSSHDTGKIVVGRELVLDTEKTAEKEKYDGCYFIITSKLKMSDQEIRDNYRGLARIEETLKISKTVFE